MSLASAHRGHHQSVRGAGRIRTRLGRACFRGNPWAMRGSRRGECMPHARLSPYGRSRPSARAIVARLACKTASTRLQREPFCGAACGYEPCRRTRSHRRVRACARRRLTPRRKHAAPISLAMRTNGLRNINFTRVHSSVVRAADRRSAGPWFKSGCALAECSWQCAHALCGRLNASQADA